MDLQKALPADRYAKAIRRSKEASFAALVDETISDIQGWMTDSRINRKVKPAVWFSGGKDSTVLLCLLQMAGVDFVPQSIDNGGDLPQHYAFIPELVDALGVGKNWVYYKTEKRMIEYRKQIKDWGNANGVLKKDGSPIDFFDLGAMEDSYAWFVQDRFGWQHSSADNVVYFFGVRGGEGMERAFEVKNQGKFQYRKDPKMIPAAYFRSLPIGNWKDLDVWAFLARESLPVSPVYSMHQLPQKDGRGAFPRTLHYCDSKILSATYYKWLSHYAPGLLSEMLQTFPEISARFAKPVVANGV